MPTRRSTGAYLSAFLLSAALFRMHIDEEAGHRAISAAVTVAAAAVVMYAAFFALSMYFVAVRFRRPRCLLEPDLTAPSLVSDKAAARCRQHIFAAATPEGGDRAAITLVRDITLSMCMV